MYLTSKKLNKANRIRMTNLNYLKKLLFIFVIIQMSNTALGKTYYVSNFGSDENSGTIAFPYKSIQFSISKLNNGDTLYIREGSYYISKNIKILPIMYNVRREKSF